MKSISKRKSSMAEIAQKAGVSPATVSRVLNGTAAVRPDRRQLVLQAVADVGYRPNRLARNFRLQSAEAIGIVVSDIENPHFTTMVRAVEDLAYARGRRVLLCNTDERSDKQHTYLEMLALERVQAVIISPSDPADPEVSELLDQGIPVVAFDRPVEDPRADAILVDNVAASKRATQQLLDAGHRRIGLIAGPLEVKTGADRRAGYEAAMRAAGLSVHVASGHFRIEGGHNATEQLLDQVPDITALVVSNNLMAIGALEVLRLRQRRIPEDVALVTIDDPFWSVLIDPALTALAQPLREMSQAAVDLVFERIEGRRQEPRRLLFEMEMRVRDSCGTIPRGSWRARP
jgi:DNA-binding LacI/PurR family transcriptional regulator